MSTVQSCGLAKYSHHKPDILKYLPRIVSILNGQQEPKNLVRSVFSSVVTTPPQTFGSVSSNLPRVRQSELLTPAELMVLLHEAEKEIGLKSAIEGDIDTILPIRLLIITLFWPSNWYLLLDD
jgi:hypothetical protein